jgi:hypothetical protein
MDFAGIRKTGSRISEVSVICQDKINIVLKTIIKLIPLEMIPLKVDVKAC